MSRLLYTEFYKLRRKFFTMFILTTAFAVAGAFSSVANSGTVYVGVGMSFSMFGLVFCAITGVFISRDFADNTIRNKLIIGHKRLNIYLSCQIVFALLAFLVTAVFIGVYILSGKIFSGLEGFREDLPAPDVLEVYRKNFFRALPVYLVAMPAYTTLGVFISMTLRNSSGGVATAIVAYALNSLSPLYVLFSENKFIEFISGVLPSSQLFLMEIFSEKPDFSPVKYILFSTAFAVIMVTLGCAVFRKTDLK